MAHSPSCTCHRSDIELSQKGELFELKSLWAGERGKKLGFSVGNYRKQGDLDASDKRIAQHVDMGANFREPAG